MIKSLSKTCSSIVTADFLQVSCCGVLLVALFPDVVSNLIDCVDDVRGISCTRTAILT